jgi:hypothetical protein
VKGGLPAGVDRLGDQEGLDLLEVVGEDDALALVVGLGLNEPHVLFEMLLRYFLLMKVLALNLMKLFHEVLVLCVVLVRAETA